MPAGPATTLPPFVGNEVAAQRLASARVAQDPALAPIPFSYLHNDTWNSDTSSAPGPLGRTPQTFSSNLGMPPVLIGGGSTGTMGVDHHGHVIDAFVNPISVQMLVLDPDTLAVLCSYQLGAGGRDNLGNAYWFIDNKDRIVVGNGTHAITTLQEGGSKDAPTLEPVPARSYDLTSAVPAADHVAGLLPDWKGRIWFQTQGVIGGNAPRVGVIDPSAGGSIKWVSLDDGEQIWNGLGMAKDGAFVVTSKKLYKLSAGSSGKPHVVWSQAYDSIGTLKPGQYSIGSGTSPTILSRGKYVTITDNASPMKVVVMRTKDKLGHAQKRIVDAMPVFESMAGQAAENSLIGYRNSIIVENTYGYTWSFATGRFQTNIGLPGWVRLDISKSGKLHKVWENDEVAANTVPTLSTRTGLVYFVEGQRDTTNDVNAYYWTALDHRTGKAVWRQLAGTGVNFDGYWSTTILGPTGIYYIATYGGLAAIRDAN